MKSEHRMYRSLELAPLLGISQRQIQHWDETKLVRPRVTSHARYYDFQTALTAAFVAELRNRRCSLQTIRKVLPAVTKEWKVRVPAYIVLAGTTAHTAHTPAECVSIAGTTRFAVHIVDTGALQERLGEGRR